MIAVLLVAMSAACGAGTPAEPDVAADADAGSPEAAEGADAGEEFDSLTVAWSTQAGAYVPQSQGPWRLGEEFGLTQEESDITELDSHATAVQLLLSGRADVATGSFTAFVQTVLEGHDVQIFCPIQGGLTDEFVGIDGLTEIEMITDPQFALAVDSPGGLTYHVLNHVFASRGLGISVADLENVQFVEDGGLRLAALGSRQADAAVLDPFEKAELVATLGEENVNTLSIVAEDINTVGFVYASSSEWLADNQGRAAAFCASVLRANGDLAEDYDEYVEWTNHAIDPDPEQEVLETNWGRATEFDIWPVDDDLLDEEFVMTDLELAIESEMVPADAEELTYDQLVDPRPAAAAVELLAGSG